MSVRLFLLILASVTLSALAQLALKSGTASAAPARYKGGAGTELLAMGQSPLVLAGLARAPLSLAYPFVGLGFILTMLAGALVLGEQLTAGRIAGTLLIACGCALVARSA